MVIGISLVPEGVLRSFIVGLGLSRYSTVRIGLPAARAAHTATAHTASLCQTSGFVRLQDFKGE